MVPISIVFKTTEKAEVFLLDSVKDFTERFWNTAVLNKYNVYF